MTTDIGNPMNAFALKSGSARKQRGVATLMVALVILFILTVIILASSNVALFEQKTATNESTSAI